VGIDQSAEMLKRAREHFPQVQYEKMRLQDMDFQEAFEGAICMDAMEHIPPEDWPSILRGFWRALKPGGVLYFTVVLAEASGLRGAYQRAQEQGLPAVMGEIADQVDEAYEQTLAQLPDVADEADEAAYHFCPPMDQVRAWIDGAGFTIEAQGEGDWYAHVVVRRE
jgi:ubiquinone/menaquinone biosynthesis C-methylase UbiE